MEVVRADERVDEVRREERGQRRADVDALDAQSEERQQNRDRLLLEPGEHQGERQVVHAAAGLLGQEHREADRRVGVSPCPDT